VTLPQDYPNGRPLTDAEYAAKKFGHYWPEDKQREFLSEKTDLEAEAFGWSL
jgi:hypothetical protein